MRPGATGGLSGAKTGECVPGVFEAIVATRGGRAGRPYRSRMAVPRAQSNLSVFPSFRQTSFQGIARPSRTRLRGNAVLVGSRV